MSSLFLTLRYLAFASFILFSAAVCIISAFNLGSLSGDLSNFPEIDKYLIFAGALGVITVFTVVFVELLRKNAYISRVAVEVVWSTILWLINLAGAAALTAISTQLDCTVGSGSRNSCTSKTALLVLTWLSTATLLSYLLGLIICAVHHSQRDSHVWHTGVRDFQWLHNQKSGGPPDGVFGYGKLSDPQLSGPSNMPPIYAHHMGLASNYHIEPLALPAQQPSVQVVQPHSLFTGENDVPPPPPPAALKGTSPYNARTASSRPSAPQISLYPEHMQPTTGVVQPFSKERSPPPLGSWPRSNPQDPPPRKRPGQMPNTNASNPMITSTLQELQDTTSPQNSRSRPTGPRRFSERPRPPRLDLSVINSRPQ